ncbi:MAG: diacylglycerol kinase family lipid kinase [Acidimicrobiia bacterium]|nr:diacylglycerol kinase family lipid kinase [Acidimicrobiia bacterium]
MTTVAVVAHRRKRLGGGLRVLRAALHDRGVTDPLWYEVDKSKFAPKKVRKALGDGADLVFVWGGDGTVQRSLDMLAGADVAVAVLPAGTANLFAANFGIPEDLESAVEIGLHGERRRIDLGVVNGEHFGVMAGTGFDALMIRDAGRGLKDRLGRAAYVWTGARNLGRSRAVVRIDVDGELWYEGTAGCVLVGNVGRVLGGVSAFDDARPDDGVLDVGVVQATGPLGWGRVLTRMVVGRTERSPLTEVTQGHDVDVRLDRKLPYELDGGDRKPTKRLRVSVDPRALLLCVPR